MINEKSLDGLCRAFSYAMGIEAPKEANKASEELCAYVDKSFDGKKADRIFMTKKVRPLLSRSKSSINEYTTTYREHSFSPDWGYVLDDGGICTTVGLNITVYAHKGSKTHNANVVNQIYTQQVCYNGEIYVEGIDFRDALVEALQRGDDRK